MIDPDAIAKFADRHKRLLRHTYDTAWQQGVTSYTPDKDPEQEPSTAQDIATVGLTGAALLAARRLYRYVAPKQPDEMARAAALAPAFASIDKMTSELATLSPSDVAIQGNADAASAFAQGLTDWVASNAWRLDNGDSVAWAGEQNGYGEAANQDGQMLEWQTEDDDNVCEDCRTLGSMPPQPLSDWPCQPGDGSTLCNVGCRCSLNEFPVSLVPGDTYAPVLSPDQQQTVSSLVATQANNLAAMMPNAAYLDGASLAESSIGRLREDYNPDEPRDDHGRWSGDGGGSATAVLSPREFAGNEAARTAHLGTDNWQFGQNAKGFVLGDGKILSWKVNGTDGLPNHPTVGPGLVRTGRISQDELNNASPFSIERDGTVWSYSNDPATRAATSAAVTADPRLVDGGAGFIPTGEAERVRRAELALMREDYSDDEPRDDHGRWTGGGGDSSGWGDLENLPEPAPAEPAPPRDTYRHAVDVPIPSASAPSLDNLPADAYDNPDNYKLSVFNPTIGHAGYDESVNTIQAARGNPDATVTVYRGGVPDGQQINSGDWVTPSAIYAQSMTDLRGGNVVSAQVPAGTVHWGGNDLNEFAYHGDGPVGKTRESRILREDYSPDEPRDEKGEWTSGGGSGQAAAETEMRQALAGMAARYDVPVKLEVNQGATDDAGRFAGKSRDTVYVSPQALDDKVMAARQSDWKTVSVNAPNDELGRQALVTHEYGHILDGALLQRDPAAYQQLTNFLNEKGSYGMPGERTRLQAGLEAPSAYGTTNRYEFVAEGLSDWYHNGVNAHPSSQAIGQIFDNALGTGRTREAARLREDYNPDQPRDYHGRWDGGGGSSVADSLRAGQTVTVTPSQAVEAVTAMKEDSTPTNLIGMRVQGGGDPFRSTMSIDRADMPRVPSRGDDIQKFSTFLGDRGIGARYEQVDPATLKPTQGQINGVKVGQMLDQFGEKPPATLITAQDGSILDGHHRWGAGVIYSYTHPGFTQGILRVDAPIDQLLQLGHEFNQQQGIERLAFGQASPA